MSTDSNSKNAHGKRPRSRKGAPGILDVAQRAGVSGATVSRYFNNRDMVRPPTRARIETAARDLGYIRDRVAGALHGRMSGTVGLIVPTIDHAIFSELIEAFSSQLHDHDRTMLIARHNYDLEREVGIVRSLLERRIDAIALVGRDHSTAAIEMLKVRDIPTLTLWNAEGIAGISSIGTDNRQGGCDITRHLIDLQHEHIALMFPDTEHNDRARDRKAGVLDALHEAGIVIPAPWDVHCRYDVDAAKAAAMKLLSSKPVAASPHSSTALESKVRSKADSNAQDIHSALLPTLDAQQATSTTRAPTAIICGNDVIAHGVIHAASRLKIMIPTQLSVVGIGDFRGSSAIEPPLTTVRLPARRIGQLAASTLIERLTQRHGSSLEGAVIPSQLIVRQSTGPAVDSGN